MRSLNMNSNLYDDIQALFALARRLPASSDLSQTCNHTPACVVSPPAATTSPAPSLTVGEMVARGLLPASAITGRKGA